MEGRKRGLDDRGGGTETRKGKSEGGVECRARGGECLRQNLVGEVWWYLDQVDLPCSGCADSSVFQVHQIIQCIVEALGEFSAVVRAFSIPLCIHLISLYPCMYVCKCK